MARFSAVTIRPSGQAALPVWNRFRRWLQNIAGQQFYSDTMTVKNQRQHGSVATTSSRQPGLFGLINKNIQRTALRTKC
jgi:hypothetical protein